MALLPCPRCGKAPAADLSYGVTIACDDCYDADCVGDPPQYVSLTECGSGMTVSEAAANWNAQVEEYDE